MALVKITELTAQLGITSRTLRYYEQAGLIESARRDNEKYRYYDDKNLAKLKQILVLRKMQIPVKDIMQIFRSNDMRALVDAFTRQIERIRGEITALTELKRVIDDFVSAIRRYGVTRLTELPLMYEEMSKQLTIISEQPPYSRLADIPERRDAADDIDIEALPAMRALCSRRKGALDSDADGLYVYLSEQGMARALPGSRSAFEYQDARGEVYVMHIANEAIIARAPFESIDFAGGLYATSNVYADEDIAARLKQMLDNLDDNPYYQADYMNEGEKRRAVLMEEILSPDRTRELMKLYLPIAPRAPDMSFIDKGERVYDISASEITKANPVLWTKRVNMSEFKPILSPHYHVTDAGEAEFIAYIDKRRLSSNVKVTIPFRVDLEFRVDEHSGRFGYGSDEGSIRLYHGHALYGVNMDNNADARLSKHALRFSHPMTGEYLTYPMLGDITLNAYNTLTWVVGDKHFAVIINGETRYCARKLAYMSMDLSAQTAQDIVIGSNGQGKRFFRKLEISQLKRARRTNIKEGSLMINTRQSNARIPTIHRLITLHYGENYWFNGAAKYVMECLGEKELDYWLFAGLTGDVIAQVFAKDRFRGDGLTDYMLSDEARRAFPEQIFARCGYAATYLSEDTLMQNPSMYINMLMAYIDKGVPVMRYHYGWGVFVGYENYGKTLLWMTADDEEPKAIPADKLFESPERFTRADVSAAGWGWVCVGDKVKDVPLAEIYLGAVNNMRSALKTDTQGYCFGANAFRAWADKIESGYFDELSPEQFDVWADYTIYVCNLATNGSCSHLFINKALEYLPEMRFLSDICAIYKRMEGKWKDDEVNLEKLGGGFNVTLNALKDKQKSASIASLLRKFADDADEIVKILEENLPCV